MVKSIADDAVDGIMSEISKDVTISVKVAESVLVRFVSGNVSDPIKVMDDTCKHVDNSCNTINESDVVVKLAAVS